MTETNGAGTCIGMVITEQLIVPGARLQSRGTLELEPQMRSVSPLRSPWLAFLTLGLLEEGSRSTLE